MGKPTRKLKSNKTRMLLALILEGFWARSFAEAPVTGISVLYCERPRGVSHRRACLTGAIRLQNAPKLHSFLVAGSRKGN